MLVKRATGANDAQPAPVYDNASNCATQWNKQYVTIRDTLEIVFLRLRNSNNKKVKSETTIIPFTEAFVFQTLWWRHGMKMLSVLLLFLF